MKALINKFLIIFVSMLFCEQAIAQTNDPILAKRCSYSAKENTIDWFEYKLLPKDYLPWGVCFHKPSFIDKSGMSETSSKEDEWTREALRIWNTRYKNYKIKEWGDDHVVGIPGNTLFVESCDRYNYNIIYTLKTNLPDNSAGEYEYIDETWDWRIFYGIILIDTHLPSGHRRNWTKELFINVMLHELGHALGIPHLNPTKTEIMSSHGYGCETEGKKQICELTDADFEIFLQPYEPEKAYVPRGGGGGGGGFGGFRLPQHMY